jgi:hypothetical protein
MVTRTINLSIVIALVLAVVASTVGFLAALTSGYTFGQYVHDLSLLIIGLGILAVAESGGLANVLSKSE